MYPNVFKIILRNIKRNKIYSIVNILGLAIGLAVFILLMLYIRYERSWDTFNINYKRIYRVEMCNREAASERSALSSYPLATYFKQNAPEIEEAVRLRQIHQEFLSSGKERTFYEHNGFFADQSVFNTFSIEIIKGAQSSALTEPLTIVLTEELAEKYFPGENPVGSTIRLNNKFDYEVTAVIKNPPNNSHLQYSYFLSFASHAVTRWNPENNWTNNFLYTYVLLNEGASFKDVEEKIENILDDYIQNNKRLLLLNPLSRIHVQNIANVLRLYLIFALFGLLLASINFMNLSTAYSTVRTKEIGIKKVVGAQRSRLIKQFISESMCFTFGALLVAFFLVEAVLPFFNGIVHRQISIPYAGDWVFIMQVFVVALAVGVISGIYPAVYLSSFQPISIFKGGSTTGRKSSTVRNGLVILQFVVSITLIIITAVFYKQILFMKTKDLGFEKNNILITTIPASDQVKMDTWKILKHELLQHENVEFAAISETVPFHGANSMSIRMDAQSTDNTIHFVRNAIDYDFINTYSLRLVEGRNFDKQFPTDRRNACLINKTAAHIMSWNDPVGQIIVNSYGDRFLVIGVVQDFHPYTTFYQIPPYIMTMKKDLQHDNSYSIKVKGNKREQTAVFIESKFRKFYPEVPIQFSFLEENFDKEVFDIIYGIGRTFAFFAILTISIASMGLFGLVAFTTERRIKEIGIRKVFGATSSDILQMIVKPTMVIMIIANLIALPIGYFITNGILQDFAYRINFSIDYFLLASFIAFIIAIITVSYLALRAAAADPAATLRYE